MNKMKVKHKANDSNDIVTLKTRLKRLTGCVRSNYMSSYCYDNAQMVGCGAPPPTAPPMPNDSNKLQEQTTIFFSNNIKHKQLKRRNAVKNSCDDESQNVNNPQQNFAATDNYVSEMQDSSLYKKQKESVDQQNQQPGYANPFGQGVMTEQYDNDLPPPPSPLQFFHKDGPVTNMVQSPSNGCHSR